MSHTRKHRNRSKHYRRRHTRGGGLLPYLGNAASYSGAAQGVGASGYEVAKVGDLNNQMNTFSKAGPTNTLFPVKVSAIPNAASLKAMQSGGKLPTLNPELLGGKRKSRKHKRGGALLPYLGNAASYSGASQGVGASGYEVGKVGDLNNQMNTFSKAGPTNTLFPVKTAVVPNQASLKAVQAMSGGKRRHTRRRKGGEVALGAVVGQALVPFTLVGMQNRLVGRCHGSRRHRRSSRKFSRKA